MNLSEQDIIQLAKAGIPAERIQHQLAQFRDGFPPAHIVRPARAGDGILQLSEEQGQQLEQLYDKEMSQAGVMKFVPASGAATRMFKDLFNWKNQLENGLDTGELLKDKDAAAFFGRMNEFAFWDDLSGVMQKEGMDAAYLLEKQTYLPLLDYLLGEHGLDYARLPKGLLKFHAYTRQARTALEEHLVEGALYARGSDKKVRLHFTVSPEHMDRFKELCRQRLPFFEKEHDVHYDISWSVQKPSTDTLAVDLSNEAFREQDGRLMLRPGGHGALIQNLNDLDAALVFVKNIDNVVPDRLKETTRVYKKRLGGILLQLRFQVQQWLEIIDRSAGVISHESLGELTRFAVKHLNVDPARLTAEAAHDTRLLRQLLNRPIRVCGMVKNEGEPGGGPFWVRDHEGRGTSLQIVESSQIDLKNPEQAEIFAASTHFNPVDLVCWLKDYRGRPFNLEDFVDERSGFISQKSKDGKPLKALELPGLWNGAMAEWNTVFVEVPLITFNPVKTINDLLRQEHRA